MDHLGQRFFREKADDWFVSLVTQWEQSMFVTAKRILGNTPDALEARQNVLLNILRKPEMVPDGGLEYWIRRCVINESLRMLRRRKTERRTNEVRHVSGDSFAGDHVTELEHQETVDALQAALDRLVPEMRVLLTLRFDEGLTIREIAQVVSKPHTTVQSQLQSALSRLRTELANFCQ